MSAARAATVLTAGLSLLAGACDDTVQIVEQPDFGVVDSGAGTPLPLVPGDRFAYRAQLRFRGSGAMNDGSSTYELEIVIQSVNDRMGEGPSELTVTVSGRNTLDMSWTDDRDFDLWGARIGPARPSDSIDASPQNLVLDGPPEIPPRTTSQKPLPSPETFFIDVRDIEAIRAVFNQRNAGRRPRVVDPDQNSGRWLFTYEGPDDAIVFFESALRRREVRLEYDRRGFLRSFTEVVGAETATETPRATSDLTLTNGR